MVAAGTPLKATLKHHTAPSMSKVPDAWEDEWSNAADTSAAPQTTDSKKVSSKVSKAQKRAQQAEFNRQLWAEAEGPKQTNYFLESRNVVPLRSEFKPPPVLLSRKGPVLQKRRKAPTGVEGLSLNDSPSLGNEESSEDEDEGKPKELTLAERQAQAAKDREEKQRKYEERRQELFGTTSSSGNTSQQHLNNIHNRSGASTPASLTPPGSRSGTPSRGGGRGKGGRGGRGAGGSSSHPSTRNQSRGSQHRELFDPSYTSKPPREDGPNVRTPDIHPIRTPRGPDGSGRGGFGFSSPRGGHVSN